ncbi:Mitochondrial escape protein 2 [Apiospora hydei]|uniref:Mitochondrial escape protein 2 n=1 Tax=Apiospora hydei TaxID=1337664 RepID=A0ABR1XCJ0_9PEZI
MRVFNRTLVRPVSRLPLRRVCVQRAWESTSCTATGDEKSGHIAAESNESILWIDTIFPLKLTGLLRTPWQSPDRDLSELLKRSYTSSLGIMDPINTVKRALPQSQNIEVNEILPRLKDGGAFVKFSHPAGVDPKEIAASISKGLQEHPIRPFFSPFRAVHAGLVKGVPWLEDLHRFPFSRLRVEFVPKTPGEEAVELSQEDLYSIFRRYGKIAEITSQPFDSKVVPRFAYVDFALVRDAIMARNCLHGFVVSSESGGGKAGTKLRMSYEEKAKGHQFWGWMTSHPRIVFPILVALLTGVTVVIFDPIRNFFVKAHVQRTFRLSNSKVYRWIRRQTSDIFTFHRQKSDQAGLNAVWSHRKDLIEQIQKWLMETAETFIVVQGPRGSGKKELVTEQALKGRGNVLVLDCKPIVEARGESATIKHMAAQVGYRPIFSWANNISSMIDLAVQSTTGVKAGFSETLESQLQKILATAASAMSELDVSSRKKTDSDAQLPVDAYLESHPEKRAVIVIDNFLHKSESNAIVYDKIAEWAAALVQSNVAHVIFLTNDSSYSKSLSKSLPDRVFRQVSLGDLSPEVAKSFVVSHLEGDDEPVTVIEDDADEPVEKASKPKQQVNLRELDDYPKQAVAEIRDQTASEVLKMFLLPGGSKSDETRHWTIQQAWYLIKALASEDSLRYNEVLLSDTFATDGEAALESLSNAELITVKNLNGRPHKITAGKPVHQAAFTQLTQDRVLTAKMDLVVLAELSKIEGRTIEKVENELALLGGLPRQPAETAGRVKYLLTKLQASQAKIESYDKESSGLKKVLINHY